MDFDHWSHKALRSVISLWNAKRRSAWRNSVEKADGVTAHRPTVTYNALLTFEDFGLFGTPYLQESPKVELDVEALLATLSPANQQERETSHSEGPRRLIFLAHYMDVLRLMADHTRTRAAFSRVKAAADKATADVLGVLGPPSEPAQLADRLGSDPYFSPFLLLYARTALLERTAIVRRISQDKGQPRMRRDSLARWRELAGLEDALKRYFEREVDRLMARRQVEGAADFDPASLAFAVRGLLTYKPESFRQSPFFASCVRAIVDGQNADGTWPDGVTALVRENADTLQQPSVKIALTLAQTVFRPSMLIKFAPAEMAVLENTLPALERTAGYLASTFVERTAVGDASGWASDRVRWPSTAETWITALAARFLLALNMAARSVTRFKNLARFGTRWPHAIGASPEERRQKWRKRVIDPDSLLHPMRTVFDEIVQPVLRLQEEGRVIVQPVPDGVSLIIFGPPGSGKTYFISQLAETLGWPLVELNPGAFISDGIEVIESKAREIFSVLMEIDHAVVFFDECDELFLDREQQTAGPRSILSFVTASMLPKLQELHDRRRVVFVVATNYLQRIDRAIRRPGRFDFVLLLDRPDDIARRKLLKSVWQNTRTREVLSQAVATTVGLTTKEILSYARQPATDVHPGSRPDYLDWCEKVAYRELAASRYDLNDKTRVIQRWNKLLSGLGAGVVEET